MRKILKVSLLILVLLFIGIQVNRPVRSNPPVDRVKEISAVHPMTPVVSAILQGSCNDCHSNQTVWPWYSNVAPASWLVASDVNNGRDALNFSAWGAYSSEKRQELMGKMCEQVKDREMPLSQYILLHPGARLNASGVQALCSWTQRTAPENKEAGEEGD